MAQPSKITKLIIGAKNVYAHKSLVKFEAVDLESDRNYKAAEEKFLAFRSQLSEMIDNAEQFRMRLKESAAMASKLAHNFLRMSQGDVGEGEPEDVCITQARRQSEVLKSTTAENSLVVEQVLYLDMDQHLLSDLKAQLESYSDINKLVKERYELKVELQHYSDKVQELNYNPKATEEKKVRNADKYATANNRLREQTDALMRRFAEAEQRRGRVLEEDLPRLLDLQRAVYGAMAANAAKAAQGITVPPIRGTRPSYVSTKTISSSSNDAGAYLGATPSHVHRHHGSPSDVATSTVAPGSSRMSEIPLVDEPRVASRSASCTSLKGKNNSPPAAGAYARNSSLPTTVPNNAAAGVRLANSAHSMASTVSDFNTDLKGLPLAPSVTGASGQQLDLPSVNKGQENGTVAATPERESDAPAAADQAAAGSGSGSGTPGKRQLNVELEPDEIPPGYVRVRALFDFDAAQPGDLTFKAGDIIFTEGGQWSTDGWVTGMCNGQAGQFPSNYTERIP